MAALDRAIEICGGVGALAARVGVVQGAVSNWKKRGRIPAEHAPGIEQACNRAVTCEQLVPGVPWAYLRAQIDPEASHA